MLRPDTTGQETPVIKLTQLAKKAG